MTVDVEADLSMAGMIWSCLNEALWFAAGFLLFRLALRCNLLPRKLEVKWLATNSPSSPTSPSKARLPRCPDSAKVVEAGESKDHAAVLGLWRGGGALQPQALEAVALALAAEEPENIGELAVSLAKTALKPALVQSLVQALLRAGHLELAQEFVLVLQAEKQGSAVATKVWELIAGTFAARLQLAPLRRLLQTLGGDARTFAANAATRQLLARGEVSEALKLLKDLALETVHSSTVTAMLEAKDVSVSEVLKVLEGVTLPMEAVTGAMSSFLKSDDYANACLVLQRLRQQGQVPFPVLEPLLKLAAKHDEEAAIGLLKEMEERQMFLSEGFCGLVLSRCGEAHHIRLAEVVQRYLRDRKMTTLATYKTLMKVFATCDLLSRACDLYDDILADGITPDSVMYGCLVKFAVKCGREDLSQRLFNAASDKPQGGDVQNYMWLIRSAGQKRDVPRAIGLLRQLEKTTAVDAAVYNSVLDVCMNSGDAEQGEAIFQEMHQKHLVTLISYNTLLKGYAAKGDFGRAQKLLHEMKAAGHVPNSASFNCLISAAVSEGDFDQAWSLYEKMQKSGVEADSFTVCILMKIVRKARSRQEAQWALSILDQSKVEICKDEVLLNTILDACIHLKDVRRLSWVLRQFEKATLKPSVQNYGLIIKAYACLKQTNKCWSVWHEMTDKEQRGLLPSDVALSCMLDAIVSAGQVDDALLLFQKWRKAVPPNTIIFSNLIKGFAVQGDAERAMDMYRELKAEGLRMNLVAYSTLMDAQARAGNLDKAHSLLEQMVQDGVQPNTITYSSLVKGHCLKSDLDGALRVFEAMVAKGILPDTVMYNTLLDGAVRSSRFNLCDQLLQEMSKSGTEPSNFTLSIIVKMWGKRKQLDKAFAAVRQHSQAGHVHLDSKLCTCLISACFHNGAPQRAIAALEEMKSLPHCDGPDAGTYEQLVEQLVKARMGQEAAKVARQALGLAVKGQIKPLNNLVLRQLQRHLEQSGHAHLWTALKEQL
ncbi:unnamed protein product [Effrenium voratum]|uniref:Pentatricopeptide repeat-containing protein n=1 Tax=Effrenium voratum TaxID=2562239 RepID=A0AA36JL99_9DINO|nr:unnamed protein product [Effrenium voratum]CAJ1414206.1 unnamed protein product [Effrenium voratum]